MSDKKFQTVRKYQTLAAAGIAEDFKCNLCDGLVILVPVNKNEPVYTGTLADTDPDDVVPALWCPFDDSTEVIGISDLDKMTKVIKEAQ